MREKINLDTMSKINAFVDVCTRLDCPVHLVDGNGYCVSAKSLIGAIYAMEWSQVFIECDRDIYAYVQDFLAE